MTFSSLAAQRAYGKVWRAANPDKVKAKAIRARYHISLGEYRAFLALGCGICGSHEDLVLDHSHDTEKIRGALCKRCNALLGCACESPEILESALRYILAHAGAPEW